MTRPLREMVSAARAMSRGEYERRVTATSRDEVGELGRAFNRMAADLAEVDRVRRDLIANVSHELRTPLGALHAMLENLVDGVETADAESLAAMLGHVERLGRLVEQLLDLSRLESGAVPLERAPVGAAALLERVAADWHQTARARGVGLQLVVEPETLVLNADETRLHQVVSNLVANAIRHAPAGSAVTMAARTNGRGAFSRSPTRGPGSRAPRPSVSSSGSIAPIKRGRAATVAAVSVWRSRAGSSSSTTGRSGPRSARPTGAG